MSLGGDQKSQTKRNGGGVARGDKKNSGCEERAQSSKRESDAQEKDKTMQYRVRRKKNITGKEGHVVVIQDTNSQ